MVWVARFTALFVIVLGRYLLIAGLAYWLCWVRNEKKLRVRKIQTAVPDASTRREQRLWSVESCLIFALFGTYLLYAWERGWTKLYTNVDDWGWLYLVASLPLLMFLHETYFYWTHRWLHRPFLFRNTHIIHHLAHTPTPWSAFAFHRGEAVVQAAIFPLLVMLVPVHVGVLFAFLLIMTVLSVINHLGYEFYPAGMARSWWGKWIITATHHDLHHHQVGYNFGLYFTCWDRWVGTEHAHYARHYDEIQSRIRGGTPSRHEPSRLSR